VLSSGAAEVFGGRSDKPQRLNMESLLRYFPPARGALLGREARVLLIADSKPACGG